MVLRGSNIKPDDTLPEIREALRTAKTYLGQIEDELSKQRVAVTDDLRTTIESSVSKEEIAASLRVLTKRLDELEGEKQKAEQKVTFLSEEMDRTIKQLLAGGLAGATARTTVAPIDRTKILIQTQHLAQAGATKYKGVLGTLQTVMREEGVRKLWRGNGTNCIRIFPYASIQFWSYDFYKGKIMDNSTEFGVPQRLGAGALAGMTAALATYPLDVIRIRLAVQPELKGFVDSAKSVWAENGMKSMYKGARPTVLSLSTFIAINFCTFDTLKTKFASDESKTPNPLVILSLGAASGIFAQTICYPLDTVRRRMQLKGTKYTGIANAFTTILKEETWQGLYKGITPNAIKVVPNNGIRFMAYTYICRALGVPPRKKKR